MSTPMRISLRAGERVYINGAVLRANRKLTIELLNNASFLLESHVLQAEDAKTPLRQLYFALQTLLIEPASNTARDAYVRIYAATRASFSTTDVLVGLRLVGGLVERGRIYDALKTLRALFGVEATILDATSFETSRNATQEPHDGREQYDASGQRDSGQLADSPRKQYG